MDVVLNLGSFVREVLDVDVEISRLLERLSVLVYKVERIFGETFFHNSEVLEKKMYEGMIKRAKAAFNDASQKTKKMGLKEKITFNLPFDRTKSNIKEAIEELEKAMAQLKDKHDSQKPVKKRVPMIPEEESKFESIDKQQPPFVSFNPTLVEEPNLQMVATLEDTDMEVNSYWVEVEVKLKGPQGLLKVVQDGKTPICDLETNIQRMKVDKKELKEKQIMKFSRKHFMSVYEKARKVVPEIDYISSREDSFELWLRPPHSSKEEPNCEEIILAVTKDCLSPCKGEVVGTQEFFSFPDKQMETLQLLSKLQTAKKYKLICKCLTKNGVFIKKKGNPKWEKAELGEHVVGHGDEICPIMRKPQRVQPAFSFEIGLQVINASCI